MLNIIAQILSNPLELTTALDQVCAQISNDYRDGIRRGILYDELGQYLNLIAQRGMSEKLQTDMRQLGLDDPLTRSIVEGTILALDDAVAYDGGGLAGPRSDGYRDHNRADSDGRTIGGRSRRGYQVQDAVPTKADVDLLQNIGRQIGKAMQNAKLYHEMQKRVEELDGLAQLSAACTASSTRSNLPRSPSLGQPS